MEYIKLILGFGLATAFAWKLFSNSILIAYFFQWKDFLGRRQGRAGK